ncbi:galactitol 2-dehydrogenase [Folsomia candida]|uniref:galactitol 2-dehydrogenase n=1 Tax=Folsomia candida TaxID=158441 RepID=UPI000B8F0F7E|nr:galactitol 2-dehydrogenase [Folsomia candida]
MANVGTTDPTIEALEALLRETLSVSKDSKVTEKLTKAQELVKNVKVCSSGILKRFGLDGQVALVTGGGQGIGRAFAHALGESGCKVAIADLELSRAEKVASELEAKGIPSLALKVDVSNKKDVEEMVKKVLDKFGDLHIGVNNAGIVFHSNSEETSETEWNKTLGVNLNGVFFCCQAEAQHMLKKGYGRIINTASMSGTIVNHPQKQVAYNTSKAAVVHMTKTLGAEWAERGVTVNCISPGYVDTELNRSESLLAVRALWIRDTPMQRLADVEDLTGACVYLASPVSSYTTGLDMIIDGGFTCW